MVAMFVGMCAAYIGSYVGQAAQASWLPLLTALVAAAAMAVCEWFERKSKHIGWKTLTWQPACWWLWLLPWVSMRCCKGGYEDGNATPFDHRGGKAALV